MAIMNSLRCLAPVIAALSSTAKSTSKISCACWARKAKWTTFYTFTFAIWQITAESMGVRQHLHFAASVLSSISNRHSEFRTSSMTGSPQCVRDTLDCEDSLSWFSWLAVTKLFGLKSET